MRKACCVVLLLVLIVSVVSCNRVYPEKDAKLFVPKGWKTVESAEQNDITLTLLIALKHTNIGKLEDLVASVSEPKSNNYGRYWSIQEINKLIAPKVGASESVKHWLATFNTVSVEEIGMDWIQVTASKIVVEDMLQVKYSLFEHEQTGKLLYRTLDHYSIPQNLQFAIHLIGGVFRFPKISLPKISAIDNTNMITPEVIQAMYNVKIPNNNGNNLQAVASFDEQYFLPSDLEAFERFNGLPIVPIAQVVGQNLNTPGLEASLDVQFLLGTPNCSIPTWVIYTRGKRPHGNEPFLTLLSNLTNLNPMPNLFSISYQDYEDTVSESYANRCNEEFMKYSATGVTFITGSGDWGVGCTTVSGCKAFTADFPSSSPYVVSTGATTLNLQNQEIGVSFSSGGFSNYFAMPSYQQAAVSAFLNQPDLPPSSYFNRSGRAFPDVAAIGTNFGIYVGGHLTSVGGTSASTPTFGSLLSMINSNRLAAGLPTLGWAQPFIYQAWAKNPNAFLDITQSEAQSSGCCLHAFNTTVGWDPYTGLGTPNFAVLNSLAMDTTFFNFPSK